jgi:hypothetical protein
MHTKKKAACDKKMMKHEEKKGMPKKKMHKGKK